MTGWRKMGIGWTCLAGLLAGCGRSDSPAVAGPTARASATQPIVSLRIIPTHAELQAGPSVEVPFEIDGNIPVVAARWDGRPPEWFLLDTGTFVTNLIAGSPSAITAAGSAVEPIKAGSGDSYRLTAHVLRGCRVQVGEAEFTGFDAEVIPYDCSLTRQFHRPIGGGLSGSLFNGLLLTVDYDRRRVTIAAGALPPVNGSDVLDMRVDQSGNLSVPVTIAGRVHWLCPDTGGGGDANVLLDEASAVGLSWVGQATTSSASTFIDGRKVGRIGNATADMRLGRYVVRQPRVIVMSGVKGILIGATLRHFRVTFDVLNRRMRLEGPVDAPANSARLWGEGTYATDTERPRDPRHPRLFVIDPAAADKGLRLTFDRRAAVIARPGRVLVIHPSGVLMDLSGKSYDYRVRSGGVDVNGEDWTACRWYERSATPDQLAPRVSTLNPYGTIDDRSTDTTTGVTTVVMSSGVTVAERPDGSTRTTLADGVVLDWRADGVIAVGWPGAGVSRRTAARPGGRRTSPSPTAGTAPGS